MGSTSRAGQTGDTDRAAGGDGGGGVGEGLKFRQLLLHGEGDLAGGGAAGGNGEVHGARPPEGVAEIQGAVVLEAKGLADGQGDAHHAGKADGDGQEDRQETGQAYLVEPQAAPAEEHQEGHHAPHGEQVQAGVGGLRVRRGLVERAAVGVGAVEVRPVRVRHTGVAVAVKRAPRKEENGLNQQDQRGGYGDVEQNVVQGREGLPPGCHEWVPPFSKWGCDLS